MLSQLVLGEIKKESSSLGVEHDIYLLEYSRYLNIELNVSLYSLQTTLLPRLSSQQPVPCPRFPYYLYIQHI
jgi:hypothetical protein